MARRLRVLGAGVFICGLVVAAVFVAPTPRVLTGFITLEQEATVSVDATFNGSVSRFAFDDVITIGNSTFFDVELANDGSVPIDPVTFELEVYNANGTLVASYPAPETVLGPGELFGRTIKHTPHETGSYTVRLTATLGSDVVRTSKFLFVVDEPQPNTDPIIITRKRIQYEFLEPEPLPEPEPEPPTRRSWRVQAPDRVMVQQGGRTTVPLRITNTGNTAVRNVRISLRAEENLTLEYNPKLLFSIPVNETKVIAVDLAAPRATGEVRQTQFSYRLRSNNLQQSGSVRVDISPTLTIAQLQDRIDNLRLLLQDLATEIQVDRSRDVNVSTAADRMRAGERTLAGAQEALDAKNLERTRRQLEEAQRHINQAFQALFEARTQRVTVEAPLVRPVYLLLLLAVLLAIVMVGVYHYVQERSERRPKLLRDMEER